MYQCINFFVLKKNSFDLEKYLLGNPRKTNWECYSTDLQAALHGKTMEIKDVDALERAADQFSSAIITTYEFNCLPSKMKKVQETHWWIGKLEKLHKENRERLRRAKKSNTDYQTGRTQSRTRRPWAFWRLRTSQALMVQRRWGEFPKGPTASRDPIGNTQEAGPGDHLPSNGQMGLEIFQPLQVPRSGWHLPGPPTEGWGLHHWSASETC